MSHAQGNDLIKLTSSQDKGHARVVTSGLMTSNQYRAVHKWVNRNLGKPTYCNFEDTTCHGSFEYANLDNEYSRDLNTWMPLCKSHHRRFDAPRFCIRGHEYTIENTYQHPNGSRKCITCSKNRSHHAKP